MFKFKKISLFLVFTLFTVLLSGCIFSFTGGDQAVASPRGVFKSTDASVTWLETNALLNAQGQALSISNSGVNRIVIDPSDKNALYLATDNGLFQSLDAASSWRWIEFFGNNNISDVAIDYKDKCNVFVAASQYIYRSTDCTRTWQQVLFDNRELVLTDVEADHFNQNIVYATNSMGDVLKSEDFGANWRTIKRINRTSVNQILMDKNDSRIVYIATEKAGLFKTKDGGLTWSDAEGGIDPNDNLRDFHGAVNIDHLAQDLTRSETLILASGYGLMRSTDGGQNWQKIELITPERGASLFSLAIDPQNGDVIYYGTESTLFKSSDGGQNWSTQKLPTGAVANYLLIDPKDSNIIYMGAKIFKK